MVPKSSLWGYNNNFEASRYRTQHTFLTQETIVFLAITTAQSFQNHRSYRTYRTRF
jgi:hypothetical protein